MKSFYVKSLYVKSLSKLILSKGIISIVIISQGIISRGISNVIVSMRNNVACNLSNSFVFSFSLGNFKKGF